MPCAVRIKLLTALFADTLRVLMTVIRRPAFCLGFGLMGNITLTLPVRPLAYGFVNNDFINQLTRHLFRQLCGLLILLDDLPIPSLSKCNTIPFTFGYSFNALVNAAGTLLFSISFAG